jgi:hypothetical protein
MRDRNSRKVRWLPVSQENKFAKAGCQNPLLGKMVEVHLLNDKRFLGKVRHCDSSGITVYCIPLSIIDTLPSASNIRAEMPDILHTLFFPYVNVEYIDIGGEPVGFDTLFREAFGGESLAIIFDYSDGTLLE